MTDREKLIELLESVDYHQRLYPDTYVDRLIANGVTVQRWIPVTERLPENKQRVLVRAIDGTMDVWEFQNNYGIGWWQSAIWKYRTEVIAHWMPIPTPPKDGDTWFNG